MMAACGVDDELWIEAVRHHHDAPPGPLCRPPAGAAARAPDQAPTSAARLESAPQALGAVRAAAAKAAYLDERQ